MLSKSVQGEEGITYGNEVNESNVHTMSHKLFNTMLSVLLLLVAGNGAVSKSLELTRNKLACLETRLTQLNRQYLVQLANQEKAGNQNASVDLSRNVAPKIEAIIPANLAPDDLAKLALWAESRDPGLTSDSYIYRYLFVTNLQKLSKIRNERAYSAIKRVKRELKNRKRYDGHLSETIEEAETSKK